MKRIVLTGGPGAGKTVISARLAAESEDQFVLVPESATLVYSALQTRWDRLDVNGRRDVQRKIYHHQIEQENRIAALHPDKMLLLDRGTIDGAAYWPDGPDEYWRDLGSTLPDELNRYDAVIWLQTAAAIEIYDGCESNACRFEDAATAVQSGEVLKQLWHGHPHFHMIAASPILDDKLAAVRHLIFHSQQEIGSTRYTGRAP